MEKNELKKLHVRVASEFKSAVKDDDGEFVNDVLKCYIKVCYPFEISLCDVLAELIRENEEIGSDEIAAQYKEWLLEVLPVASRLAGCNLVYHGITDTDVEE